MAAFLLNPFGLFASFRDACGSNLIKRVQIQYRAQLFQTRSICGAGFHFAQLEILGRRLSVLQSRENPCFSLDFEVEELDILRSFATECCEIFLNK